MSRKRTTWPRGHVVHMNLEHLHARSLSVARCDCGWENRVPWPGHYDEQDAAIETHWRSVEASDASRHA